MEKQNSSMAQDTQLQHIETAYNICRVIIIIAIIILVIVGIVLCFVWDVVDGLCTLFGGLVSGLISLYFSRIMFGFLCDVKIIRNKIESVVLVSDNEKIKPNIIARKLTIQDLQKYKEMYESGLMSKEDFERVKSRYMGE